MFQDYENFPNEYYGESGLKPELWDYIEAINNYDKELVDTVLENGYDLNDVKEFSFYPNCHNKGDFAQMYIDETGGLENLGQDTLESYFDYQSFGRDLAMDIVMIEHNGGYLVKYY
jgi:antirestriction protein